MKSSTAILDPNKPGSTSLKLSWIWHSAKWLLLNDNVFPGAVADVGPGPSPDPDPVTLYECEVMNYLSNLIFFFLFSYCEKYLVKRVHFLCARALKNRWDEEHILLNYEMQWMVRFFKKKLEKWKVAVYSPNISSGAKAYALRREYWWKAMSIKSDTVFKNTSVDYITPLI